MEELNRSDLCTVKQLAARHPAFTEASLRFHIFMARPHRGKATAHLENGLESAIVRIGRKVLISEAAFLAWVQSGKHARGGK